MSINEIINIILIAILVIIISPFILYVICYFAKAWWGAVKDLFKEVAE